MCSAVIRFIRPYMCLCPSHQIGEFYEAVGFDGLVLCQYCGLNPMSPQTGVPEAGFPRAANSLRRQLNRLIEAGFTVVSWVVANGRWGPCVKALDSDAAYKDGRRPKRISIGALACLNRPSLSG